MPERRGSRFVVEALFLAALATALALARLDVLAIAGAMALGWLIVALIEWAAWRSEPHYGSGLPPRYYLPDLELPPAQPLEQVRQGYPDAGREEAPTWIASAALRAEMLGEWPRAEPVVPEEDEEPEFVAASQPGADPWTVAELPAAPLEVDDEEPGPGPEPEPVPAPAAPRVAAVVVVDGVQRALYRLDPLGSDAVPRRRFRRAQSEPDEAIEVAARPAQPRPLPAYLR